MCPASLINRREQGEQHWNPRPICILIRKISAAVFACRIEKQFADDKRTIVVRIYILCGSIRVGGWKKGFLIYLAAASTKVDVCLRARQSLFLFLLFAHSHVGSVYLSTSFSHSPRERQSKSQQIIIFHKDCGSLNYFSTAYNCTAAKLNFNYLPKIYNKSLGAILKKYFKVTGIQVLIRCFVLSLSEVTRFKFLWICNLRNILAAQDA